MDVYRYVSFEEFMSLITFHTLHFVDPMQWDDSYEGCIYRMIRDNDFRQSLLSNLYDRATDPDFFIKAGGVLSNYCHLAFTSGNWYAQCWTHSADESDALWRIYSYGRKSIRIKSSTELITKSLEEHSFKVCSKCVTYDSAAKSADVCIAQFEAMIQEKKTTEGFFHKRAAFSHEKEYRFLITPSLHPKNNINSYPGMIRFVTHMALLSLSAMNKEQPFTDKASAIKAINDVIATTVPENINSIDKDINITVSSTQSLIQDVLINPLAENWYVDLVRKICEDNNIKCSGKSDLYSSVL